MATKFLLIHGVSRETYGTVSFNGKFVFELAEQIDPSYWDKIGFIKLAEGQRRIESTDLFTHLNARLPITLRGASNDEKIKYIENTGLRVASDSFYMERIKD
jgi:hypothetical protein